MVRVGSLVALASDEVDELADIGVNTGVFGQGAVETPRHQSEKGAGGDIDDRAAAVTLAGILSS